VTLSFVSKETNDRVQEDSKSTKKHQETFLKPGHSTVKSPKTSERVWDLSPNTITTDDEHFVAKATTSKASAFNNRSGNNEQELLGDSNLIADVVSPLTDTPKHIQESNSANTTSVTILSEAHGVEIKADSLKNSPIKTMKEQLVLSVKAAMNYNERKNGQMEQRALRYGDTMHTQQMIQGNIVAGTAEQQANEASEYSTRIKKENEKMEAVAQMDLFEHALAQKEVPVTSNGPSSCLISL
jgi:hypothetical protein